MEHMKNTTRLLSYPKPVTPWLNPPDSLRHSRLQQSDFFGIARPLTPNNH